MYMYNVYLYQRSIYGFEHMTPFKRYHYHKVHACNDVLINHIRFSSNIPTK